MIKIKKNEKTYLIGKIKRREKFEQKKKRTKYYKNSRNNYRGYRGEVFKNYK